MSEFTLDNGQLMRVVTVKNTSLDTVDVHYFPTVVDNDREKTITPGNSITVLMTPDQFTAAAADTALHITPDASLGSAMSGNMHIVCTPATLTTAHASVTGSRTVTIALVDAVGNYHTWFNGALTIAATEFSTSGTVAIQGGGVTVTFVNGVATVLLNFGGSYTVADTNTLTVSGTVLGYALNSATSVQTAS